MSSRTYFTGGLPKEMTVSLFCHHLFTIHRPAFDERPTLQNCANQGWRTEFIGMCQLQIMSRHCFMHGQVAAHVIIVFLEERFLTLCRPILRCWFHREKCFAILLERPR